MHLFLKSAGFSGISNRKELNQVLDTVVKGYDEKLIAEKHQDGAFCEFTKYFSRHCGITVCGQYDEDNKFILEYYFPFCRGSKITTSEPVNIDRQAEKESFLGSCDDYRIGVTLIFYLQSPVSYMLWNERTHSKNWTNGLTLSALGKEGMILLPLRKDKEAAIEEKANAKVRNEMIAAAMKGDEEALENLTIDDMDIYSMISERIVEDDILSIQYTVLGEILDIDSERNIYTGEEIVYLLLETNDVELEICINRNCLLGEPAVGRRFKGSIWLQGRLGDMQRGISL